LATTSPYLQHHYFATWVEQNETRFAALLAEGERVCGEWLAQAHGTKYRLWHEPFVPFDIMRGSDRATFEECHYRLHYSYFVMPRALGAGPMSIEAAMTKLGEDGFHGAIDPVEGAIWRVERKGKVDFLVKYVRHDKVDGKYLPENNGTGKPVWNINLDYLTPAGSSK